MALVRLIGSQWDGSRVKAPKREIPEYGVKLKLKGRNFRVKHEGDELVAYYLGELSTDVVQGVWLRGADGNMRPRQRFDDCEACNYDQHTCYGCGDPLSHDGINLTGSRRGYPHGDCLA